MTLSYDTLKRFSDGFNKDLGDTGILLFELLFWLFYRLQFEMSNEMSDSCFNDGRLTGPAETASQGGFYWVERWWASVGCGRSAVCTPEAGILHKHLY